MPVLQKQRLLSENQVSELVRQYVEGASVSDLVTEFGIHRTTVLEHLERRAIPRRRNVRKLTDADVERAAKCYVAGDSLRTVAFRFGVDASTISRELRKAGVELRKRRGWS